MLIAFLTAVAIAGFFVAWHFYGGTVASLLLVLFTLTCFGVTTFRFADSTTSLQTVATPYLGVQTYQIALILAVIAVPGWVVLRKVNGLLASLPILLFGVALAQDNLGTNVMSGIVQWAFFALAWAFGAAVAFEYRSGRLTERALATTIAAVVCLHVVGVIWQLGGGRVVKATAAGSLSLERLRGFADHSGQLGKLLLLMMIFVLPLSRSNDIVTRRLTLFSITASAIMIALTYSRANMSALAIALGIWFLFGAGGGIIRRLGLAALVGAMLAPFVDELILRQKYDPTGGLRPQLLENARIQMSETLWWGVGPNNYLPVLARWDPLAAAGLPVHNSALLALAELGLVAFALLALPIIALVIRTTRSLATDSPARPWALAVLANVPGFAVIIATGHGLTSRDLLLLFAVACGFAWEMVRPRTSSPGENIRPPSVRTVKTTKIGQIERARAANDASDIRAPSTDLPRSPRSVSNK
jgi:hypothetical protein